MQRPVKWEPTIGASRQSSEIPASGAAFLDRFPQGTKVCPCKTPVPLYRKHVFAEIKPTTQTRIDLGLALGKMKIPKRLIDTGGFAKKDRITHRIPITRLAEIDDEVKHWLKTAYDLDA